jgi:flagellar hook-basal body complex protein FliE
MADLRIIPPLAGPAGEFPSASANALPTGASGDSFVASLKDALAKINEAQSQADVSVQSLLTGQSTNLHETMIALQKADVSFQLMLQVRNKIVGAYEEIMRMQL